MVSLLAGVIGVGVETADSSGARGVTTANLHPLDNENEKRLSSVVTGVGWMRLCEGSRISNHSINQISALCYIRQLKSEFR